MNGMEVENATFEESTVDEDMTAPEHLDSMNAPKRGNFTRMVTLTGL